MASVGCDIADVRVLFFDKGNRKNERLWLYGGGFQTMITVGILSKLEIPFVGIVTRNLDKIFPTIPDKIPKVCIEDMKPAENDAVIVAVNAKHNEELTSLLRNKGFHKIYLSSDWIRDNDEIRNRLLLDDCEKYGAVITDESICYRTADIDFRIARSHNPSYQSMLAGEWHDIVAPSIFGDYQVLDEGPYEYEEVCLLKGDMVIDLGANIGLFSCVAAAKGCEVFAFEPTKEVFEQLQENVRMNPSIYPFRMAASDMDGMMQFYEARTDSSDANTGNNTLLKSRADMWNVGCRETMAKVTRLDTFVAQQGLQRIDFIKADIEGAERNMLSGAQNVLRDFGPKLALCTYHLPDDPEVMERLILEANPNYRIVHKWKKLYAYIP